MSTEAPAIGALLPWFGSGRMQSGDIAAAIGPCAHLAVPFAGGLSELDDVEARAIVANDLHRHSVNLARVVADPPTRAWLTRQLDGLPFHPDVLAAAQDRCLAAERDGFTVPNASLACDYFVTQWMGRSGKAGTNGEFAGKLPVRWTSSGGGSNVRYRSAVASIEAWGRVMRRCEFVCMDAFDFLAKCKDAAGHVIYADPPWPGLGDDYKHVLSDADHRRLAKRLADFVRTKVVVRINDHPIVRGAYPEADWEWARSPSRNQANNEVNEVLLVRRRGEPPQLTLALD